MVDLDKQHELVHMVQCDCAQAPVSESGQSQPCVDRLERIKLSNCELKISTEGGCKQKTRKKKHESKKQMKSEGNTSNSTRNAK